MSESSDTAVQYALEDTVAIVRFDDGKANAISHDVLNELNAALDRAEKDGAKALLLTGRPGRFSAGFDLSVMTRGVEKALELAGRGGHFALRLVEWPTPVVFGVTGHALAMGAVLLMTADERIGAEGSFKIGLNEVGIGMTLPDFALELAAARLSRRHLQRATSLAEIYTPAGAVDAGFLDRIVPPESVEEAALDRARQLAATLDPAAHRGTKRALRAALIDALRKILNS